jgi:hypothetical protein
MRRGAAPGTWRATWRIENLGDRPLEIIAARCPHGKFRSGEKQFTPAILIGSKQAKRIDCEVRCDEPAGAEVENAFLLLRALWGEKPWLILARLRVRVNNEGVPETDAELITSQPVGFSRK